MATRHPEAVHGALDRQLGLTAPPELAGRFAIALGRPRRASLSAAEAECLDALIQGPAALDQLSNAFRRRSALAALVTAGDVAIAAFCPSDAAHVLRLHHAWDREAATKAATLFARQRGRGGRALAPDASAISRVVVDSLIRCSAERLLDVALGQDGIGTDRPSLGPVLQRALSGRHGLAEVTARLAVPVIGLGASAAVYYPEVGRMLDAEPVIPADADVANAIGAVVGRVRVESRITIGRPDDGRYRILGGSSPLDFASEAEALARAEALALDLAAGLARQNGLASPDLSVEIETLSAPIADRELILEWRLTGIATGRPGFGPAPV